MPALIAAPLRQIAARTAAASAAPARAARFERNLRALAGRLLSPGGWAASARRASGEPLGTGRARQYDESTLRQAAREMRAAGAVAHAEQQLEQQVHRAVGTADVTAFTDVFDQVFWTKKLAWAAPIGRLGNRLLAATYFGMTFVRTADGPILAYHASWHKPASPLIDPLQALHANVRRHRWLSAHARVHVLDRGTQGTPTLRWAKAMGVPYLTLAKRAAQWRRFGAPTHHTATAVPIFVRRDTPIPAAGPGRAVVPKVIIYPARPAAGVASGRALRYRTAADLTDAEITTLDAVYKARWPNNENPIKALIAVGFDRNLDRTLVPTTSRGHDGDVQRRRADLATIDTALDALKPRPAGEVVRAWLKLHARRDAKVAKLAAVEAAPAKKGARSDRGGEMLCKLITLLLYNALALLLWKSALAAVQTMTPARVRELLLGRSAHVTRDGTGWVLAVEALLDPTDLAHQEELIKLFNEARLKSGGTKIHLRLRDPPAIQQVLRIAA